MNTLWAFVLGLLIGAVLGFFVACLLACSHDEQL